MKKKFCLPIILVLAMLPCSVHSKMPPQMNSEMGKAVQNPEEMNVKVQPFYRHRKDGKPGREVVLYFSEPQSFRGGTIEISSGEIRETISFSPDTGKRDSVQFLLPSKIGVKEDAEVDLALRLKDKVWSKTVTVPALRHWTVFVYPHSHVDIGYSNTHKNVELIHKWNIEEGIKLAQKTGNYPEGARYLWNTEVIWPLERAMKTATDQEKKSYIEAVEKGQVCLDAAYVHVNTSTCSEEELFQLFRQRREWTGKTGKPIDVMVQVDIPGMSWGIVPVLAHEGIRYIMMLPNGTRGNQEKTYQLNQKPFWWVGPDGESKVLFLQPGSYAIGLTKGATTGRPWFGQRDTSKIPRVVKTEDPRKYFLDDHLFETLPSLEEANHPYDIFVVTWAMWDNAPQDADLPEAVKTWNEEYAFPRLEIKNAHDIMQTFEKRYGDDLPEIRGDYTEYWTDNMGVAARETKRNREAKERLLQAETVWSMLYPGKPAPRSTFDEAWRNVIMASEHTYAFENQMDPFFFESTWKGKKRYFREAEELSIMLLDEALAPATDKSRGAMGPPEGPSNGGVSVINTHSWPHGGLVTLKKIESQTGDRVIDDQGNEVRSQRLSSGELVFLASAVPAFGSRHYRVVPGECSLPATCRYNNYLLENEHLQVKLDPETGNVIRLINKTGDHNFASPGKGLNAFYWQPARGEGDARSDSNIVISVRESGPLLTEVEVSSQAQGCRSVVRRIRLIHGQPWVEFSNTIDKLPLLEKDGIHSGYHFNIPEPNTHIDIPWGVMQPEKDQWPAANRAWMAAQHWVDISNKDVGVTWCSLDVPLIEIGQITAKNTAGWDGKGDIWPSELTPSSSIYSWVMNNHWYTNTPPAQDGPVTFRYRAKPHNGYDAASAHRFGLEQAQPLVHVLSDQNAMEKPLVATNNDQVFINVLKPSADGHSMIVRASSLSGEEEFLRLSWPGRKPKSVFLCENAEKPGDIDAYNGVNIPPMGMVTLYVEW